VFYIGTLLALFVSYQAPMLIIKRSSVGESVVFSLSGRIEPADVEELQRLIGLEQGEAIVLDLQGLAIIDREALKFLARRQAANIKLENCPVYIREWIDAERGRGGQD
jgi:anti-anti-sigma regulatory factor